MFELTVLFSAFTAFFGVFVLNRLLRLHHPLFDHEPFMRVTNDAFFLVIESVDPKFSEMATREFLEGIGAGTSIPLWIASHWHDAGPVGASLTVTAKSRTL